MDAMCWIRIFHGLDFINKPQKSISIELYQYDRAIPYNPTEVLMNTFVAGKRSVGALSGQ